jgi:DNA-binding LacI/PurR family transcriptional regulator
VRIRREVKNALATIDDVAKIAGVSKSTVSNVFSKKRPISKEVADRVLEAALQLKYKPNYWARSLANKETRIIGLSMEGEKVKFGAFHMTLLNGVLKECYSRGYRLLVNTLPKDFSSRPENWSSDPTDGEILLDPVMKDPRLEEKLLNQVPVVVIGRPPVPYETAVSYVDNDNVGASFRVVEYLLELGHRQILFLNAPGSRTVAHDREAGYRRAYEMKELKPCDSLLICREEGDKSSADYGYRSALRHLAANPGITAVITDTDKVALGVYQAAEELKLTVAQDLSVFSFSVEPGYGAEFTPPLSCVHLDGELLGTEAARMLLDQCAEKSHTAKRVIIPSELLLRESCGKPVSVPSSVPSSVSSSVSSSG